jgi:HK97 family phage major capsid protein
MELKQFETALEGKVAEMKAEVNAATEKAAKAYEGKVAQINEELTKTNKSLEEARQEVLEAKAAFGRIKEQSSQKVVKSYADQIAVLKSAIGDLVVNNYDSIKEAARINGKSFSAELDSKAVGVMLESTHLTGDAYLSYVDNPFMRSFVNPHLRSVFGIIPVSTGSVSFPRGNNPVGEGSVAEQTEGAKKAELDYDVTMINVPLKYIAGTAKISRQMIDDLPFVQSYLQTSLIEDFQRQENIKYLNAIAASATAGSSSGANTAEKFIDYVAQLGGANWNANLILTTYAGWSSVLKTLPSGGSYSVPGGLTIDNNGNVRIMGIPVVPHSQVTAGKAYVMDVNKYKIAQQAGLAVRSTEYNVDDFEKNLLTFRVESRCELLQYQPTAAIYGNI